MMTCVPLWQYVAEFFLEWGLFQTEFVEKQETCAPVCSPCKSRWNAVETPYFSENQKLPSMFVCCKPSGICILGCGRSHAHKISCLGARCYDCLRLFTGTELDVCREVWCFVVTLQRHTADIKQKIYCCHFSGIIWNIHPIVLSFPC
jgi:hypothetical protein